MPKHGIFVARLIGLVSLLVTLYFLCRTLRLLNISKFWVHFAMLLYLFSWIYPLHHIIITEPLFLALFMVQLWLLAKWTKTDNIIYLVFAGFMLGVLLLTRYAAMGIGISIFLWILFTSKHKIRHLIAFIFPTIILFFPWQWLVIKSGLGLFGRTLSFHPPGKEHYKEFVVTFANWLSPGLTKWLVVPVFIVLSYIFWKNRKKIHFDRFSKLLLFILGGYFLFIILAITWADFNTPLNNRILAPLFIVLLIFITILLDFQYPKLAVRILGALVIFSYTLHFIWYSLAYYRNEIDVIRIHDPHIIRLLQNSQKKIYSNAIDIIKLDIPFYNRLFDLPDHYHPMTLRNNPNFDQQLKKIRSEVSSGQALVVYFYGFDFRKFQAQKNEILSAFNGLPIREFRYGLLIGQTKDSLNLTSEQTTDFAR